ncbi:hypothetical protein V3C99_011401, partial [Haemonchus contortus]
CFTISASVQRRRMLS